MNIYVVVEGLVAESKVYRHWIPLVNPRLTYVQHITEIIENNFSITIGGGYPRYNDVIDNAIADINTFGNINRLVIAVDSEEMTCEEKYDEIYQHVSEYSCKAEIKIVVQHYCLETWALGNKAIISRSPQSKKLREYIRFYNVSRDDPELLPAYDREELNKSQFSKKYLKYALNDKYRGISYSSGNPRVLLNPKYFERVKQRRERTPHIRSFQGFLEAFI